jgi:uncharacterized protein YbbK (DUF523 family)/uncharacterized protein YbgA (DUF1722 family)
VKIGFSSCLLGQEVRYNGGHKRDRFLVSSLSQFVDYIPVCPEVAVGLGIPRPPIRLVGDPDAPRAVGTDDPTMDVTARLQSFAQGRVQSLGEISGYILKKDSPSCGMERVKVYSEKGGAAQRKGQGVFAQVLMERMPLLPVEEEGWLNDPVLKENFLTRVFVFQRWQRLVAGGLSSRALIAFHTDHKFLLMAQSQAAYQRMGRMRSDLGDVDLDAVALPYVSELMSALKRRATRKRHANTLQHMAGYLKRSIDSDDKQELNHNIDAYRRGSGAASRSNHAVSSLFPAASRSLHGEAGVPEPASGQTELTKRDLISDAVFRPVVLDTFAARHLVQRRSGPTPPWRRGTQPGAATTVFRAARAPCRL